MDFKTLRAHCKYEHPGYDEDHQLVSTCRHKDSFSEGCSWGLCREALCPIMAAMQKEPMNRGDAIRQLDNKGLALLFSRLMDAAAIKTIEQSELPDVVAIERAGRLEHNIEKLLEFLDGPADADLLI